MIVKTDEKFTKRMSIWGLLRRVARPDKPWSFVQNARWLFNSREQALKQANEFNVEDGTPACLYKPVRVLLEVEIDAWIRKETEDANS